mmetsp:Transcript_3706/g.7925  ORF Transcript_3706/g.7925 Transcript_3706/m.7925 type:complete len:114 (+) Transcript_3706:4862-5203(+)
MSDSEEVLPKKRSAEEDTQEAAKKLKAQENDSEYEPSAEAGSEESDPELYSDEYEHGDVEDFDTEAYLRFCQKTSNEVASENGVESEDDEISDEGEMQKPTSCSQDQESSSDN